MGEWGSVSLFLLGCSAAVLCARVEIRGGHRRDSRGLERREGERMTSKKVTAEGGREGARGSERERETKSPLT